MLLELQSEDQYKTHLVNHAKQWTMHVNFTKTIGQTPHFLYTNWLQELQDVEEYKIMNKAYLPKKRMIRYLVTLIQTRFRGIIYRNRARKLFTETYIKGYTREGNV